MVKLKKVNILIIIHFVLSFFYERLMFNKVGDYGFEERVIGTLSLTDAIPNELLVIITYVIAKIFFLVFLIIFYNAFFYFFNSKIAYKTKKIIFIFFMLMLIFNIIYFPDGYRLEIDNYLTYSLSIRLWPYYWHNMYTTCYLAATYMIFPHPIMPAIVQGSLLVILSAYIYLKLSKYGYDSKKYIILLILPSTFDFASNVYRIYIYTIVLTFIIYNIIFERDRILNIFENNDVKSNFYKFIICLLISLISIWRSEGIIIGALVVLLFLFLLHMSIFKKICLLLLFVIAYVIVLIPQYLGNIKYFDNDYKILNYFQVTSDILNSTERNISYDGANTDLENIEKACSLEYISGGGLSGYRSYWYEHGHRDFNQTCFDKQTSKEVIKSFNRFFINNMPLYLKCRFNYFFKMIGLPFHFYVDETYKNKNYKNTLVYDSWKVCKNELLDTYNIRAYNDNIVRRGISFLINKCRGAYNRLKIFRCILYFILIPFNIFGLISCFYELIKYKSFRKVNMCFYISAIMMTHILAMILFIPEPRYTYIIVFLYISLFNMISYISIKNIKLKNILILTNKCIKRE